jgi:O-Antigen ligase
VNYLFILPAFFSLYYLFKGRRDLAFLNVYLPSALLFPPYYNIRIPHLPVISVAQAALLPLGISLLLRPGARLKFRRMDLWITLFLSSMAVSELTRENSPKDGFILFAGFLIQMLFPYLVGRCLIEPHLRVSTVKRIILLFLCLTPAILFEYKMGENPWLTYGQRIFSVYSGSFVQLRGGHARVQACFAHAILAGILFFIAFLLNCSLSDIHKRDKIRLGPRFSKLERYHVPALLLIAFLYLTGSRGPMMSGVVGFSFLQIPRFRNKKVGATVVLLFLAVGGAAVYSYFNQYTSATDTSNMTEEQTSAIYRREMLENYKPVIEAGGWLGWGALSHPQVQGQVSIDNSYLLIQLSQGKMGLYLFLLMGSESVLSAVQFAFRVRSREDRVFAFSMVGALVGLFASLYSVYLGDSVMLMCFLLLGWSQSLQESRLQGDSVSIRSRLQYQFKRVFA